VVDTEDGLGALDGERLDLVDELLALVVALARVALGVLVGQHRAGGLEHGGGDVVLRRDEAHLLELALGLAFDELSEFRIGSGKVRDRRLVHGRASMVVGAAKTLSVVAGCIEPPPPPTAPGRPPRPG
jgi:hypothetical protein